MGAWEFAGKSTFASTGPGVTRYLTASTWRQGPSPVSLPAMAVTTVGAAERCLLYRPSDGSFRVQLGSGSWIGLREDLGWLILVDEEAAAVPLLLAGAPAGLTWRARTSDGRLVAVSYTTDDPDPLLTINGEGTPTFAPRVVTPSLASVIAAHGCPGGDLAGVDLAGVQLTGLDLTGADLSRADLTGTQFTDTVTVRTLFHGATLSGATFNGADLSQADFTGASLDGLAWGRPKRAANIVLTGCSARDAHLGGDQPLDCSGASLATGDFTRANLSHCDLTGADLSGATLRDAVLDHGILDGARLRDLIAPGASLRHASLRGSDAQGADLAHADLSFGDLTRIRMGSRAYLFSVAATFAPELDAAHYAPADLVAEFRRLGVTITDQDLVSTEIPGRRWTIQDSNGQFRLQLAPGGQVDVFVAGKDLAPACLAGAICQATVGTRASLAGADLRRISWQGSGATLDHADLSGASMVGGMLAQIDLTQAYLDGADLSDTVLVQAMVRGCLVHAGADGRAPSLDRALLMGADFSGSTLAAVTLVDAGVAVPAGVPLFTLPLGSAQHLTPTGLAQLAPTFAAAGHPLGSTPGLGSDGSWQLDNSACTDPTAPVAYRIVQSGETLYVSDAEQAQTPLFTLSTTETVWLDQPAAGEDLVQDFGQNSYTLALRAPITADRWWLITPASDAPFVGPAAYPRLRVDREDHVLGVYGTVLVLLRDWRSLAPDGLAFQQTIALDRALDERSIGPGGLPKAAATRGAVSWKEFWTCWRTSRP